MARKPWSAAWKLSTNDSHVSKGLGKRSASVHANIRNSRRGFTLTELLVVLGLIAVLISLLLPAVGKAKSAANSAACLSNLRQMGIGWTMYMSENKGRLPEYVWLTQATPELAWQQSWLGILD